MQTANTVAEMTAAETSSAAGHAAAPPGLAQGGRPAVAFTAAVPSSAADPAKLAQQPGADPAELAQQPGAIEASSPGVTSPGRQ